MGKCPKREFKRIIKDDCAKDYGKVLLPRCIAFFNRITIESLKIHRSNAVHLGKKFVAAIFSAIIDY